VGQFLSSIAKSDDSYLVVRTLRITNEKKDPPRASDAKFESAPDAAQSSGADAAASEGLELLGDTSSATDGAAPEAKVADSSRILSQVLGDEQIQVFLRLDVLQFLPAKKLP
jgi:hypothetical protein